LRHGLPKFRLTDPDSASTPSNNPSTANHAHPLQLLFKLGTTLRKQSVNPLSQVHECFNGHP
jgi:hypothetical protein